MLIFWKERLAFLANSKTGSTAIEAALEPLAQLALLQPPELKHTTARSFRRYVAPYLESAAGARFTSVALMREPIDWLGSWFRWRQREEIEESPRSTAGVDFATFAEAFLSPAPPAFAAFPTQAEFLCDDAAQPAVDRLYRYEAIGDFLAFLEDRLDCHITLPRLKVSPAASLALDAGLTARLRARLAPDYALYESLGR